MARTGGGTAAIHLLKRVLATGWFGRTEVAARLATTTRALDDYLAGTEPMPLDRQLRLAAFVINDVPPLARAGHRLRGRVSAEMTARSAA